MKTKGTMPLGKYVREFLNESPQKRGTWRWWGISIFRMVKFRVQCNLQQSPTIRQLSGREAENHLSFFVNFQARNRKRATDSVSAEKNNFFPILNFKKIASHCPERLPVARWTTAEGGTADAAAALTRQTFKCSNIGQCAEIPPPYLPGDGLANLLPMAAGAST